MGTHEHLGLRNNPNVSRQAESQLGDRESAKKYIRNTMETSLCTCHSDQPGICAKRCPSFSKQRTISGQLATTNTH